MTVANWPRGRNADDKPLNKRRATPPHRRSQSAAASDSFVKWGGGLGPSLGFPVFPRMIICANEWKAAGGAARDPIDSRQVACGGNQRQIPESRALAWWRGLVVAAGRVFFRLAAVHDGADVGDHPGLLAVSDAAFVHALVQRLADLGGVFRDADGGGAFHRAGGPGRGEFGAGWQGSGGGDAHLVHGGSRAAARMGGPGAGGGRSTGGILGRLCRGPQTLDGATRRSGEGSAAAAEDRGGNAGRAGGARGSCRVAGTRGVARCCRGEWRGGVAACGGAVRQAAGVGKVVADFRGLGGGAGG